MTKKIVISNTTQFYLNDIKKPSFTLTDFKKNWTQIAVVAIVFSSTRWEFDVFICVCVYICGKDILFNEFGEQYKKGYLF